MLRIVLVLLVIVIAVLMVPRMLSAPRLRQSAPWPLTSRFHRRMVPWSVWTVTMASGSSFISIPKIRRLVEPAKPTSFRWTNRSTPNATR